MSCRIVAPHTALCNKRQVAETKRRDRNFGRASSAAGTRLQAGISAWHTELQPGLEAARHAGDRSIKRPQSGLPTAASRQRPPVNHTLCRSSRRAAAPWESAQWHISTRGSGHDFAAPPQETFEGRLIFLPHLAEHPADSFVDEVFFVAEEKLGHPERVGELTLSDEVMRRDNADPSFPHVLRAHESHQWLPALVGKITTDDFASRCIHQIPVVNVARVCPR